MLKIKFNLFIFLCIASSSFYAMEQDDAWSGNNNCFSFEQNEYLNYDDQIREIEDTLNTLQNTLASLTIVEVQPHENIEGIPSVSPSSIELYDDDEYVLEASHQLPYKKHKSNNYPNVQKPN